MEKLESIIFGLKAEVERLQGEIERMTREQDEMFDRHAKENQAASILIEQRNNEIAELQKQVDELKEQNMQLSEMADYDKGHKEGYEHGAKITAKELLQEAENLLHECAMEYANAGHKDYFGVCENISWKVIRKIAKDKGVEVE